MRDGARDGKVLADRQVGEQVVPLEAAGEPLARAPVRRLARHVYSAQAHRAGVGDDLSRDDVEQRGLSGTVRADEPVALAGRELEGSPNRSPPASRTSA